MVTRWRACNINQRSTSKVSQSGQQQRLEGGTGTAGGRRGFWSSGTGSSIEETTAGQKKGAGLGLGGATFRGIQGFGGERLAMSCCGTGDRRKASRFVAGSRKAQIRRRRSLDESQIKRVNHWQDWQHWTVEAPLTKFDAFARVSASRVRSVELCVAKSSLDTHSRRAQGATSNDWAGVLMEATRTRTRLASTSVRWFVALCRPKIMPKPYLASLALHPSLGCRFTAFDAAGCVCNFTSR